MVQDHLNLAIENHPTGIYHCDHRICMVHIISSAFRYQLSFSQYTKTTMDQSGQVESVLGPQNLIQNLVHYLAQLSLILY